MKVVAAYLLARLGGNACPSVEDLKNILGSVEADANEDRIELLLSEVKGKGITELVAAGRERLASVPSGAGGLAVAAQPTYDTPAEAKKEEKVEEEEEEEEEEPVDDLMLDMALFD